MTKLFKMPTNHRVSNKSKESESQEPSLKGLVPADRSCSGCLLVPLLQLLLRLHEFSNSHGNVGEKIFGLIYLRPICVTATAIIIHARARARNLGPRSLTHVRRRGRCGFSLCLINSASPFLHVIAKIVPYTMGTATHTAIVRL